MQNLKPLTRDIINTVCMHTDNETRQYCLRGFNVIATSRLRVFTRDNGEIHEGFTVVFPNRDCVFYPAAKGKVPPKSSEEARLIGFVGFMRFFNWKTGPGGVACGADLPPLYANYF